MSKRARMRRIARKTPKKPAPSSPKKSLDINAAAILRGVKTVAKSSLKTYRAAKAVPNVARARRSIGAATSRAIKQSALTSLDISTAIIKTPVEMAQEQVLQNKRNTSPSSSFMRKTTTCKPRPPKEQSRKGSGGSRDYVPWCEVQTKRRR